MARTINHIITTIASDELNPMVVDWDLEYWYDTPASTHPDSFSQLNEEIRQVAKINSVQIMLMNKVDLDVTEQFTGPGSCKALLNRLESELLEEVESTPIEELLTSVAA